MQRAEEDDIRSAAISTHRLSGNLSIVAHPASSNLGQGQAVFSMQSMAVVNQWPCERMRFDAIFVDISCLVSSSVAI